MDWAAVEVKAFRMDLEEFIKYVIWIIFFAVALLGVYFLLKKLGVM